MQNEKSRIEQLFLQYLNSTCTKQELTELLVLLNQTQNKGELERLLEQHWNTTNGNETMHPVDWDAIYAQIIKKTQPENIAPVIPITRNSFWWKAAAIAIIAYSVAFFLHRKAGTDKSAIIAQQQTTTIESKPFTKNFTDHQTIKLPDGSTVVLNAGSKISYPASFLGNTREVTLTGEAYFDIAHNAAKPFIVHTGAISTKVLGTAFNIRAYASEKNIAITVTRGKVQVLNGNAELGLLTANEQIDFNKDAGNFKKEIVFTPLFVSWKEEEMIVTDMPLDEIVKVIEEKYHVQIKLNGDGLSYCRFTASFAANSTIEQVLTVITELSNSTFKKQENDYIITGKGCN